MFTAASKRFGNESVALLSNELAGTASAHGRKTLEIYTLYERYSDGLGDDSIC